MMRPLLVAGTALLTLSFGLMAGFFFAFSFTVMPGLDLLAEAAAIDAMQAINVAVRNPVFFAGFALPPVLAFALALGCLVTGHRGTGLLLLVTGVIYLAGVVALTATINVPMNRALAEGYLSGHAGWLDWSAAWTGSNHLRMLAASLALLMASLAMVRLCQGRVGVAHRPG